MMALNGFSIPNLGYTSVLYSYGQSHFKMAIVGNCGGTLVMPVVNQF